MTRELTEMHVRLGRREPRVINPHCTPRIVALRRAASSVCADAECDLSGGYAHAGPCETCKCGLKHAIAECPESSSRPAYNRAAKLIDALNAEVGPGRVVHGALQAAMIAEANALDAKQSPSKKVGP
jgi:hypothetical protein